MGDEADILNALVARQRSGGWGRDLLDEIIKRANEEASQSNKPSSPPTTGSRPATVKPATPAPVTPPTAPPVLMRATMRVHFSKFTPNYLPREVIYAMMRNQVVPGISGAIPANMIDWCEKNCADLWMPSPPERPEYIMFASEADMTLFLTAFGGGR